MTKLTTTMLIMGVFLSTLFSFYIGGIQQYAASPNLATTTLDWVNNGISDTFNERSISTTEVQGYTTTHGRTGERDLTIYDDFSSSIGVGGWIGLFFKMLGYALISWIDVTIFLVQAFGSVPFIGYILITIIDVTILGTFLKAILPKRFA